MVSWHARMFLLLIVASAAAVVASGLDWGLPSSASDAYLFASKPAWTGATLADLDTDRVADGLGADVDRNPVDTSHGPVEISRYDHQRAEILRRYRLYSHQPDEMITFMALQQMRPAQLEFDPRLYQYGGVWIYPVGAMLKAASVLGIVDLRADKAFYYDHPDAFGRFYVVARTWTLLWFIVLLLGVGTIARKLTHSDPAALAATAVAAFTPAVFALAHEAKPHLGGAALMLLACLAAGRWIERGKRRDAIFAGAACGLAVGMVLSSVVGLIILPVMIFLRRDTSVVRLATLATSLGIAALSYALTNPYVPIHLITDPAVLKSNLGNTRQMYAINGVAELFRDGGVRLLEAASVPVLGLGLIAVIIVLARRRPVAPLAVLLTSVSIVIVAQFFAFAGGKPGEYGRFAIFPVVALSIAAVWGLSLVKWQSARFTCFVLAPASVAVFGAWPYFQAFLADTRPTDTRSLAAAQLASSSLNSSETLQVFADPAPYSMPPVDLWKWHILLSDPAAPLTGDVVVRPVDYPPAGPAPEGYRRMMIPGEHRPAPITWADKPIEILIRE